MCKIEQFRADEIARLLDSAAFEALHIDRKSHEPSSSQTCPRCDSSRGVMSVPETHKGSDFSWYQCSQCNHLWSLDSGAHGPWPSSMPSPDR